jgi:hypothetical protein
LQAACFTFTALQALLELCRFRNRHPAFHGRVFVDDETAPHELHVRWYSGSSHMAVLWANLETHDFSITHTPYPEEASADARAGAPAATSVDVAAPTAAAGMIAAAFGASVGDGVAAAAGVSRSQDLASIFSIDALDPDARAAVRKQMAEAALQELDSRDFNSRVRWSGSAAAAEELFSEMLGSADHDDFLEARKEARKLPAAAPQAMEGQGVQQTDCNAAVDRSSSSSSNGSNGNGGGGHAGNGQSSGSKGRVAKKGRVPVGAGVSAGAGQLQGFRDVLLAAAGGESNSYNGCNTSASESETDDGSGAEVNAQEALAVTASVVAAGDAMEAEGAVKEGNGNGIGSGGGQHGVLQQLDLSYGWQQPDQRCEAAIGG